MIKPKFDEVEQPRFPRIPGERGQSQQLKPQPPYDLRLGLLAIKIPNHLDTWPSPGLNL